MQVLFLVFFDYRGIVHHEVLTQGAAAKKEYYFELVAWAA